MAVSTMIDFKYIESSIKDLTNAQLGRLANLVWAEQMDRDKAFQEYMQERHPDELTTENEYIKSFSDHTIDFDGEAG